MPVSSLRRQQASGRRRGRGSIASILALAGLGTFAACSGPARGEKREKRALAQGTDAPELSGIAAQLAAVASNARPSLVRVYNETHTFKSFGDWAAGLASEAVGLVRVNPYYEYPYKLLRFPLYLLFGELDLGNSFGSGFVVATRGPQDVCIITNAHVIENAARIECELIDGRRSEATIVSVDESRDLALLRLDRLEGARPPAVRLRRAPGRPGEPVLATGFPGRDVLTDSVLGLPRVDESDERPNPTVTLGVISAIDVELGNDAMRYLETDAAINHGGSGGPVLDVKGQAVGVVEMIGRDSANEGYAIPSSVVLEAFANELGVAPEASGSASAAPARGSDAECRRP